MRHHTYPYRDFPEPSLDAPDFDDPNACPRCGQELAVDADEDTVEVWCANPHCPEVSCGRCEGTGVDYDDIPGEPQHEIPCATCQGFGRVSPL